MTWHEKASLKSFLAGVYAGAIVESMSRTEFRQENFRGPFFSQFRSIWDGFSMGFPMDFQELPPADLAEAWAECW